MTRHAVLALLLAVALPASAQEGPPRISTTEAHLLSTFPGRGGDDPHWVLTLQHFSTWKHGSNFFFVDVASEPGLDDFFGGRPGVYLELIPVLSLGSLGVPVRRGPLLDVGATVQLTTGWVAGEAGIPIDRALLGGAALAWAVPGFRVFGTELLARAEKGAEPGWQLTWVYDLPLPVGREAAVSGYLDLWRRERGGEAYLVLLAQPKLLVSLAESLQAGVELEPSYNFPARPVRAGWNLAVSPMVRWVF